MTVPPHAYYVVRVDGIYPHITRITQFLFPVYNQRRVEPVRLVPRRRIRDGNHTS